jgi:hypothetical protein
MQFLIADTTKPNTRCDLVVTGKSSRSDPLKCSTRVDQSIANRDVWVTDCGDALRATAALDWPSAPLQHVADSLGGQDNSVPACLFKQ